MNGVLVGSGNDWTQSQNYSGIGLPAGKNVIAVKGTDAGSIAALLVDIVVNGRLLVTDTDWKVTDTDV